MGFKTSPSDIAGPVHWRGIPSGTVGGAGSYLGIASDNQVVLTTLVHGGGGGVAQANQGNNRVITSVDADNINAEANLTFDGSQLAITGQISGSGKAFFVSGVEAVGNIQTSGSLLARHNVSGSGKGFFHEGIETGGTLKVTGSATFAADILPLTDDDSDIGTTSKRFANIHANNIYTGDLHLQNEKGNWTMIEDRDFLTIRNNKTGKLFKLLMEEID